MNAMRSESGELQMFVGIGLNGGEAVCGNMVKDYMDYTVIGDNINIAARLCGLAQPGTGIDQQNHSQRNQRSRRM